MNGDLLPSPNDAGRSAFERSLTLRNQRLAKVSGQSTTRRALRAIVGPSKSERSLIAQERSWTVGAEGEQMLGRSLERRCPSIPVLNDRRIPGSRANIDHIAVAPSGVYVIDTKRYRGKIKVVRPMFGAERLEIAGRNRTKLIAGLDRQVKVVRAAVREIAADVPVHGCLCFVAPAGFLSDSSLPVLRTLHAGGYPLYYPKRLARRLNQPGELDPERTRQLLAELSSRLPPASRR